MTTQSRAKVLVQGTADWNQPIATNQHYVVRELAKSVDVTFVESLGLRRPEFTRSDARRALARFHFAPRNECSRPVPESVTIVSPRTVPIHNLPLSAINKAMLKRQLHSWKADDAEKVYWTYSPVTYGFESGADKSIYHCVDLYGKFPGIDPKLIDRHERRLASAGVRAIGSSEVVVAHLESRGFQNVIYWPNVADTAEIRNSIGGQRPRIGALFAGNLSDKKVDFQLLHRLLDEGIQLHLAGPIAEGGGSSNVLVRDLIRAGAIYHGVLTLAALTPVMRGCSVGLIPYQLNSYTRGVSPLKTYEYLAAGLAVVATDLPGVERAPSHVSVCTTANDFVESVRAAHVSNSRDLYIQREKLADQHSWIGRGAQVRALVQGPWE